jgi:nicotinamidase-related amidase
MFALLVIDLQNEFFEPGSPALPSLQRAAEYVNETIAVFRRHNLPIVVVRDVESPERVPGKPRFEVHPSIAVKPSDIHIDKHYGNAFWKTDLETRLRDLGVNSVILTGYCAEYCVLATQRGAKERGFTAAVMRGSLASGVEEHITFVERICDVVSYGLLEKLIATSAS